MAAETDRAPIAACGVPYLAVAHNANNPAGGRIIWQLGMTPDISYQKLWQPESIWVMDRIDFENGMQTYREYRK